MKAFLVVVIVVFLGGCAGSPTDDRYVDYGQVRAERVRIPPCNPFHADELMDWATELDGPVRHNRSARAVVDADGRVRCSSKESGSSRLER